jgi:hypothetical protein
VFVALLTVLVSACGAWNTTTTDTGGAGTGRSSWALPAPAGPDGPSVSAQEVCSPDDGQKEIAAGLGVVPTRVEPPT